MKLKNFIDAHIVSNLYPDEKLLIVADRIKTIPYGVNYASAEIPEDSRHLKQLHDVIVEGKLASDVYFSTATHSVVWRENTEKHPNSADLGCYRGSQYQRRWLGFVADDVFTKIPLPNLRGAQPTWASETSMGNFQYAYMLKEPLEDLNLAKAFLQQAKAMNLTDAGGLSTCRLVRLPTGLNTKPTYEDQNMLYNGERYWKVRTTMLSGRRYDIYELAEIFGMDLHALSMDKRASIGYASPDVVALTPNKYADAERRAREIKRDRESWGLKVLAELQSHNMVKMDEEDLEDRKNEQGGYIDIVCPWVGEHTGAGEIDNNGDTQFSPVGWGPDEYVDENQFICRHAHCADRNVGSLKAWALAKGWINDEDLADKTQPTFDQKLIELIENKILVGGKNGGICDIRHPHLDPMGPQFFNLKYASWAKHGPKGGRPLMLGHAWGHHPRKKHADYRQFVPGRGPLVKDGESGLILFNTWQPTRLEPKVCKTRLKQALNDHFDCICGDDNEYYWARGWMASCIIHPEIRHRWVWVSVCVAEGTGRGTNSSIARALLGPGCTGVVTTADLLNRNFNDWGLTKTFVHVPEFLVYENRSADQRKVSDAIKQIVSEPFLEVNTKYGGKGQQQMTANLFLASNHTDAMEIGRNDRRFFVTMSEDPPLPDPHYLYLNGIIDNRNRDQLEQILGYFKDIDESQGDEVRRTLHAPMTAGKEEMMEITKTEIDHAVDIVLEDRERMPWASKVLAAAVRKVCASMQGAEWVAKASNRHIMAMSAKALRGYGLRPAPKKRLRQGSGGLMNTWSLGGQYTPLSGEELFKMNVDGVSQFWGEREQVDLDKLRGLYGAELANRLWGRV